MKKSMTAVIAAPVAIALSMGGATAADAATATAAAKSKTLKLSETSSGLSPKTLHATAGTVVIAFTNRSGKPQRLIVEKGTKKIGSTPAVKSGMKTLKLKNLSPGKYTYYCSGPGKTAMAMKGTLTVKKYVEPVIY